MKSSSWVSLCGLLAALCVVRSTYTSYSRWRCACNGRSQYCRRDAWGLHCVDCQGNTEGRHCERCKDGFYSGGAGLSCTSCRCNAAGSISATCDSRGRCNCKEGVTGEKCNRCADGPIGPNGCSQRRQVREDSGSLPCFCYGHSSQCLAQSGYSIHKISSSFSDGPDGWRMATVQDDTPEDAHFRWSPKHQDLEVISSISRPIYLYAPARYLGNHLLSYGQNFSFSLRLDRGVRDPSTSDVILEGGGLQVTTSLSELPSAVPCGQKINYVFRLDEQPGSRWKPQLTSLEFQTLLQNLTAIKIRATFGERGRGYLDNVQLVSAQRGRGVPANWVWICSCPPGYEGEFCERCSPGFGRTDPMAGAFGGCRAGSCDPNTGDCYSADETAGERSCDCDLRGSETTKCDDRGRCQCRPGFEGLRCQRSSCPDCFRPLMMKMESYADELKQLETLFTDVDQGTNPTGGAEMEAAMRDMEERLDELRDDAKLLSEAETALQGRVTSISRAQLADGRSIKNIAEAAERVQLQQQTYERKVEEVQTLMKEMKRKLERAKEDLRSAEVPMGDDPQESRPFSSLVQTATRLADRHQMEADAMQRSATAALKDSEQSLALVRSLMNKENKVKEQIGDLKTMYDQASAQAEGMENQATRLSSEAKDESNMANNMLKDISNIERFIPSTLKEQVDAMVSKLRGLTGTADGSIEGYDVFREGVQRDLTATEDLLTKGRKNQQEVDKLLERVNVAKTNTEDALQRINSNSDELDGALNTLKGFDEQISDSRSLANDATKHLPRINATIQQAVRRNVETQSVLDGVSADYSNALDAVNVLEKMVNSLEGVAGSFQSHAALLNESTKLHQEADNLRTTATAVTGSLNTELDAMRRLEADGEQASAGAAGALNHARKTRAAVGKTLQGINSLLANMNESSVVDEGRLEQLEASLSSTQAQVDQRLGPRLRGMEEQEAAQRRRLTTINLDIDTILSDITNLEDILKAIPSGCFNSPPIEEA